MNMIMNKFSKVAHAALLTLLVLVMPVAVANAAEEAEELDLKGVVISVDPATREVFVGLGMGITSTLYMPESVDMDGIAAGDNVTGTYFSATAASDFTAPTAEDLANPWEVLQDGALAVDGDDVTVAEARLIRGVVTVVAIVKEKGIVGVKDSRDMTHLFANVSDDEIDTITVGQEVVLEFTEAMAITLN